jgi:radical SAM superfamily enzyme YgiQ (UPF0313 family)
LRIALINVSGNLSSEGSRLISALLKRAGHAVQTVFLARGPSSVYPTKEMEQLHEILKDVDLTMIAVYSTFALRAVQITQFIRNNYPEMKVIWGGPHCVSAPDLSLRHADGVCFAEGDQAILDFVNKLELGVDYTHTANMAFNVDGKSVVNDVLPPFSELDSLPYPDYDFEDQFLLHGKLLRMTTELARKNFARYPRGLAAYWCLTARGCPYSCSYCNNCRYIAMHGRNPIRFRKIDHFLGELDYVLRKLDFFEAVGFADDDFLARPTRHLEEFAEKYKTRVGLPFIVEASANTYRREKLEILLDAGLRIVQMGVQSGSQRVLDEVFNRRISVSKTIDVARQIDPYHETHNLQLLLDFIIDTPYETGTDIIETYRYLVDVPQRVMINVFVLSFFPGTPLYDRAVNDGFIEPFDEKTFRPYGSHRIIYQNNYETLIVLLIWVFHTGGLKRYIPASALRALGSRRARGIGSALPKPFYAFSVTVILVAVKAFATLFTRVWYRGRMKRMPG